jgi:hypothetical protein
MARPDDHRDDEDLDHWLDGLRGRDARGAHAATREEARQQRAAIAAAHAQRMHGADGDADRGDDPQGLQRLLFRLRREGLLAGEERAASRWRARLPLAAAAAVALGLSIAIVGPALWQTDEAPVLRGGPALQVLEVDASAVADTAARVQQALLATGAIVSTLDTGGGAREVAATVPRDRLADAARVLAPFGLSAPAADGVLRIEVRPRAAKAP